MGKDLRDALMSINAKLQDQIERLTKDRDEARNEAHAWSQESLKQVGEIKAERDALKAEVECLKGVIEQHRQAIRDVCGVEAKEHGDDASELVT